MRNFKSIEKKIIRFEKSMINDNISHLSININNLVFYFDSMTNNLIGKFSIKTFHFK